MIFRSTLRRIIAITGLAVMTSPLLAGDLVDSQRLDALFAALPYAQTQDEANTLTLHIWEAWNQPRDPELAALMESTATLSGNGQIDRALATLDTIVTRWPDYAEGWNRRAAIHRALGNYDASLTDISETLAREPRHFGALISRVEIQLARGHEDAARGTMLDALRIHPFLSHQDYFQDMPPVPVWI